MRAIATTGHITGGTIAVAKLVLLVTLGLSIGVAWSQLLEHLAWRDYDSLAQEVAAGRFKVEDFSRLQPYLMRDLPDDCAALRIRTPAILHLYGADLVAKSLGLDPFLPSDNADLNKQREQSRQVLERSLICAPLDGDFWLKYALIQRALGAPADIVERSRELSQRYTPHEGWIQRRRDTLF
jgi:hypothetical protein